MILSLISIVFGSLILLSMITLISIEDHKAKSKIKPVIAQDLPASQSWKDRFIGFLGAIKVPDPINQLVDKEKVIWSGIQLTHYQFISLCWLLSLIEVFLGFLFLIFVPGSLISILLILFIILILVLAPGLYIRCRIRSRKKDIERNLPDYLDMLTLHIEAGVGFLPALKNITNGTTGELKEEFGRVLVQMDLGYSKREVLEELSRRLPSSDMANLAEAILLSDRLGTSLARTMRVQANLLRSRRRQRAEVQARTAPVRIIPALVFFFLPGLLLIYLAPPIINFLYR